MSACLTVGFVNAASAGQIVYGANIDEATQRQNIKGWRVTGLHPTYTIIELWNSLSGVVGRWNFTIGTELAADAENQGGEGLGQQDPPPADPLLPTDPVDSLMGSAPVVVEGSAAEGLGEEDPLEDKGEDKSGESPAHGRKHKKK